MSEIDLKEVVDELCSQCNGESRWLLRGNRRADLPSRTVLIGMVEDLRSVLFPGYFGTSELSAQSLQFHLGSTLDRVLRTLQEQIRRGLWFVCPQDTTYRCAECKDESMSITHTFLSRLPRIRALLSTDVAAAYEGDPAATGYAEILVAYPSLHAVTIYDNDPNEPDSFLDGGQ